MFQTRDADIFDFGVADTIFNIQLGLNVQFLT